MRDRNKEGMQSDRSSENVDRNENESSRRPGSGSFGSATGRTGSLGNRGGGGSDISRDDLESRDEMDSEDRGSVDRSNPSSGRH